MNGRPPADRLPLDCAAVNELGAAYAIGALDPIERSAVDQHVAGCPHPHAELRGMLGAGDALAAGVEPVPPPAALRDRLMATIASTPQEAVAIGPVRAAPAGAPSTSVSDRWLRWLTPPLARGLVAAAVVVLIALAAWNMSLQGAIAARDQQLRALAAAIGGGQAAFRATGSVGSGYVVQDSSGRASLIVADLAPLEASRIYELWLIGADGTPVAVGTFDGSSAPVAVVPLERGLGGFTTFAVTVESQRVSAPTSKPVMVASLGG